MSDYTETVRTVIDGWVEGVQKLALLRAAAESGVLEAAATDRTSEELATITGLEPAICAELCSALEVVGILSSSRHRYRLSTLFQSLSSRAATEQLLRLLRWEDAKSRAIQRTGMPSSTERKLSGDDLVAVALWAGPDPLSARFADRAHRHRTALPEVSALWEAGGSDLEVGCGAGGSVLSRLLAYPLMTAVGVDTSSVLLKEAARRAELLGVSDRVEWRCMDARELNDEVWFDTAYWSQQFFDAEGRDCILKATRRALKPGGYLLMNVLHELPHKSSYDQPFGQYDQNVYKPFLHRLAYRGWGLEVRSPRELKSELRAAGFRFLKMIPGQPANLILSQRPAPKPRSKPS